MAAGTFLMSEPVKFMYSDEEGKWSVTSEAKEILQKMDHDLSVIAIAGKWLHIISSVIRLSHSDVIAEFAS